MCMNITPDMAKDLITEDGGPKPAIYLVPRRELGDAVREAMDDPEEALAAYYAVAEKTYEAKETFQDLARHLFDLEFVLDAAGIEYKKA